MGESVPKGTVVPDTCGADVEEQTVGAADFDAAELAADAPPLPELHPASVTAAAQAAAVNSGRGRGRSLGARGDTRHSVANPPDGTHGRTGVPHSARTLDG